mmetsp:Transcript_10770/g.19470  ORF Transcript_10770/g.19470 Transcript_10770/m.19470 type:complete len:128 (+) Transcript_10770:337-720(+)
MANVPSSGSGANSSFVPEQGRAFSREELAAFTGDPPGTPVYVAVRDVSSVETTVFDVSSAANFYGPGGPYHLFAGKNASHGLATGSLLDEDVEKSTDDLGPSEIQALMEWHAKYTKKYVRVGYLKRE